MSRKLPPAPRSSIRGIEWPALSSPNGRTILSLLYQFEQSEWWSGDDIQVHQFRQLGGLLAHACENVPYYRERFKKSAIKELNSVTPEEWRKLPFLRRKDIQAAGKKLHSEIIPRGHGKVGDVYTSGTTGEPIRVLRSELCGLFWSAFTLRDHLWHGRDFSGKLAVIRNSAKGEDPYPDGTKSPRWGDTDLIYETGPGVSLNINCTIAEQVDWLEREAPKYLLTHPTNVYRLAGYCLEKGIGLNGLEQVQTISEILRPEVRDACKAAWGVGVVDMYSGRDVGYLALQCPESGNYHVQSEGVFLEVLDDEGRSCSPGQTGRVVVTTLHNYAMPLIRYEIGDYAEVGGACSCGRGLAVLKRILGREQDLVTLPGGDKRWTLLSSGNIASFLEIAPIRQYQFVQKNTDKIEVRLVTERELTDGEIAALRQWMVAKLGHPFAVDFSFVDEIAREPSGKYRDFVSEIS